MNKKILINRLPVEGPWGGGNNFVKAIHKYAPEYGYTPVSKFDKDIDVIFMIDPRYDNLRISINEIAAYKKWKPNTKVIYRINECDQRKGLKNDIDPIITASSKVTDLCIFISQWIKDYHVSQNWLCENNKIIYSGTNKLHFCKRNKINNGKINLVTHHWSDNINKGHEIYVKLDEWVKNNPDYTFTYIGRTKANFKNTKLIPPTFGEDLGKKLSKYDVYISASKYDPGPNHIIESLACNIPTYALNNSGGAAEMVGNDHLYDNFENLEKILLSKDFKENTVLIPLNWKDCIEQYFKEINKLFT